jgi:hypothetical protein
VLIPEHNAGFIDWATYENEANRSRIAANTHPQPHRSNPQRVELRLEGAPIDDVGRPKFFSDGFGHGDLQWVRLCAASQPKFRSRAVRVTKCDGIPSVV